MSKTILAEVKGWTPVIDALVEKYGLVTAIVFGRVWRYCQMKDGVCKASQSTIADDLGLARGTVNHHIDILVSDGFLFENKKDGFPNELVDTGKASLSLSITGGVILDDRGCNPELQGGVIKNDIKIVNKTLLDGEEKEKTTSSGDFAILIKAYEDNIGFIGGMTEQMLSDDLEQYGLTACMDGIEQAVKQNKRKWSYVQGVLKNKWSDGYSANETKSKKITGPVLITLPDGSTVEANA